MKQNVYPVLFEALNFVDPYTVEPPPLECGRTITQALQLAVDDRDPFDDLKEFNDKQNEDLTDKECDSDEGGDLRSFSTVSAVSRSTFLDSVSEGTSAVIGATAQVGRLSSRGSSGETVGASDKLSTSTNIDVKHPPGWITKEIDLQMQQPLATMTVADTHAQMDPNPHPLSPSGTPLQEHSINIANSTLIHPADAAAANSNYKRSSSSASLPGAGKASVPVSQTKPLSSSRLTSRAHTMSANRPVPQPRSKPSPALSNQTSPTTFGGFAPPSRPGSSKSPLPLSDRARSLSTNGSVSLRESGPLSSASSLSNRPRSAFIDRSVSVPRSNALTSSTSLKNPSRLANTDSTISLSRSKSSSHTLDNLQRPATNRSLLLPRVQSLASSPPLSGRARLTTADRSVPVPRSSSLNFSPLLSGRTRSTPTSGLGPLPQANSNRSVQMPLSNLVAASPSASFRPRSTMSGTPRSVPVPRQNSLASSTSLSNRARPTITNRSAQLSRSNSLASPPPMSERQLRIMQRSAQLKQSNPSTSPPVPSKLASKSSSFPQPGVRKSLPQRMYGDTDSDRESEKDTRNANPRLSLPETASAPEFETISPEAEDSKNSTRQSSEQQFQTSSVTELTAQIREIKQFIADLGRASPHVGDGAILSEVQEQLAQLMYERKAIQYTRQRMEARLATLEDTTLSLHQKNKVLSTDSESTGGFSELPWQNGGEHFSSEDGLTAASNSTMTRQVSLEGGMAGVSLDMDSTRALLNDTAFDHGPKDIFSSMIISSETPSMPNPRASGFDMLHDLQQKVLVLPCDDSITGDSNNTCFSSGDLPPTPHLGPMSGHPSHNSSQAMMSEPFGTNLPRKRSNAATGTSEHELDTVEVNSVDSIVARVMMQLQANGAIPGMQGQISSLAMKEQSSLAQTLDAESDTSTSVGESLGDTAVSPDMEVSGDREGYSPTAGNGVPSLCLSTSFGSASKLFHSNGRAKRSFGRSVRSRSCQRKSRPPPVPTAAEFQRMVDERVAIVLSSVAGPLSPTSKHPIPNINPGQLSSPRNKVHDSDCCSSDLSLSLPLFLDCLNSGPNPVLPFNSPRENNNTVTLSPRDDSKNTSNSPRDMHSNNGDSYSSREISRDVSSIYNKYTALMAKLSTDSGPVESVIDADDTGALPEAAEEEGPMISEELMKDFHAHMTSLYSNFPHVKELMGASDQLDGSISVHGLGAEPSSNKALTEVSEATSRTGQQVRMLSQMMLSLLNIVMGQQMVTLGVMSESAGVNLSKVQVHGSDAPVASTHGAASVGGMESTFASITARNASPLLRTSSNHFIDRDTSLAQREALRTDNSIKNWREKVHIPALDLTRAVSVPIQLNSLSRLSALQNARHGLLPSPQHRSRTKASSAGEGYDGLPTTPQAESLGRSLDGRNSMSRSSSYVHMGAPASAEKSEKLSFMKSFRKLSPFKKTVSS